MASVNFLDLSQKFLECFFENSKKTETIDPILADDITATIENKTISSKAEVLKALEAYMPLEKAKAECYQPFRTGSVITAAAKSKDKNYSITFSLEEVDTKVHRFGVKRLIIMEKC